MNSRKAKLLSANSLDYFKENVILMLKVLKEYKANLLWNHVSNITRLIIIICFFLIFGDNFASDFSWTKNDFLLYGILVTILFDACGILTWRMSLRWFITRGDLNQYLLRPISPFFGFSFSNLAPEAPFALFIDICALIIFFNLTPVSVINLILGLSFLLVLILLFLVQNWFFKSTAFFSFGLSRMIWEMKSETESIVRTYPGNLFVGNNIANFFMIIPYFFISTIVLNLILGYEIWQFKMQMIIIFSMFAFYIVGTIINWHFGLKNYEAFG